MKLGPTLAATLACVLAFAAADTPADVAPQGAVAALAVSPQGGRVLVGIDGARPGSWLFLSDDHGTSWQKARGVAGAAGVTALAFAPSRPSVAYAAVITRRSGHLASGFFASGDGGASWHATAWKQTVGIFGRQLPAAVDTIVVDPHQPRTVYAVTHGVLRRSLNGGASWTVAQTGRPVVVASHTRGLVERIGGQAAWKPLGEPPGGLSLFTLDPASADRIYGAAYTQNDATLSACATLWASLNAGMTWRSVGAALPLARKNCV